MAASTGRPHIRWVVGIALLCGLVIAGGYREIMSTVRTELGGVALDRGLVMLQERPWEPNPHLDKALRNYQAAVSWNSGNAHAWRKLGEVFLTLGQNEPAREALTRAADLDPDRVLYQVLLGDAYDGLGASQEALAAWLAGHGGTIRRDAVLVNGAKIASAHIDAGDPLSAVPVLVETILKLDPENLFALATVVTAYDGAVEGDHPLADPYREAARYPSRAALQPGNDPRLPEFQARGAAQLYRSGYWDEEMVGGVARYWAAAGSPAAVHLAEALSQGEPERTEWLVLRAEALVRAGRASEAVTLLESVGADAAPPVQRWQAVALLALARASGEPPGWSKAEAALVAYAESAPTDLWPLAALAQVREQLGDADGARTALLALQERTDGADLAAAAEAMGLSKDAIALGDNLVPNGGFEEWENDRPADWIWSDMATGDPWNLGVYSGGSEQLLSLTGSSVRLQGVWQQADPEKDAARAGYWLYDFSRGDLRPVELRPGSQYVLSLDYLVDEYGRPTATVWLSYGDLPCWRNDRRLDATTGEWQHFTLVCEPASAGDDPLRPLVRLFGTGVAMYDNLQIREVLLTGVGKEG